MGLGVPEARASGRWGFSSEDPTSPGRLDFSGAITRADILQLGARAGWMGSWVTAQEVRVCACLLQCRGAGSPQAWCEHGRPSRSLG